MAYTLTQDVTNIRSQLGNEPDKVGFLISEFPETVMIEESTLRIDTRDVSGDGAWGKGFANASHTVNNLYWGSTGAIWQSTYTNSLVLARVVNPQNVFREHFLSNEFINTTSSNCTISLGATGSISFTSGQSLISEVVQYQPGTNITKVTFNLNTSMVTNPTNLTYYVSTDGTNWESTSLGTEHYFTTISDKLYYKIVATGSATIDTTYYKNSVILALSFA